MTAIERDEQFIRTRTFREESADEFRKWLVEHSRRNIYYHVNPTTYDVVKKAERNEILEMRFLHVDVDPRVGENFEAEHARIRSLFEERRPSSLPPPSALIFSGGGFNAIWRLTEALPVARDALGTEDAIARAEDVKRYNLQLEILLGGDNCHNVDRILRLPGSVNWPDKKKRAKGRVPDVSRVVAISDAVYPVSAFVAAPPVQMRGDTGGLALGGGVRVNVSGNVARLGHVSELGDKVSDRIKMIVVQGHDPDEPTKFGSSRSEWLFHVCCALVRGGVTDDMIYSVITDPGFLISASVLDKGSRAEKYAMRQIQRAREDAIDPHLRVINEKHAVVGNVGGRCRVIEEVVDYSMNKAGRPRLTLQSFDDFRNRYMAERVETGKNKHGETVYAPLGTWWLQNKDRRQFETIVFSPGREQTGAYNLWRGFDCEAKPGTRHESYLDHLRTVICSGNDVYCDYLVRWMARAVQQPDTQGEVAIVLRGDQGTGKSTVAREFGKLWGRHYLPVSDPKHLVGSFNAHLRDAVFVFADEAFYAGDKKHESILKTLVTEDILVIEGKGRDAETSRNYVHLMMASNGTWVVPAGPNERRYFILDVPPSRMRQMKYFAQLASDMDTGGRENLLHYLLTLDLAGFDVRTVPQTDALREQKMLSFSQEQEWWYGKLVEGRLLRQHASWTAPCFKEDLLEDYLVYMQRLGVNRRANATSLGRFIHHATPEGYPQTRQLTRQYQNKEGVRMQDRSYAYLFPSLVDCRKHWDSKFGGPYPWPQDEPSETKPFDAF